VIRLLTLNGVTGEDDETPNQRLTCNINELLSELRVAQAGVRILFGFLLLVKRRDKNRCFVGCRPTATATDSIPHGRCLLLPASRRLNSR
jgi:Family of unknown function (DUF6328)